MVFRSYGIHLKGNASVLLLIIVVVLSCVNLPKLDWCFLNSRVAMVLSYDWPQETFVWDTEDRGKQGYYALGPRSHSSLHMECRQLTVRYAWQWRPHGTTAQLSGCHQERWEETWMPSSAPPSWHHHINLDPRFGAGRRRGLLELKLRNPSNCWVFLQLTTTGKTW